METTRYDDCLHLKFCIEKIFGRAAWAELKDCSTIKEWRKWIVKSLKAHSVCVSETIKIVDSSWKKEYSDLIDEAIKRASTCSTISDLISGYAGDMLKISFLQLGLIPDRGFQKTVSLSPENWRFDRFRSVQYVQSNDQKDNKFLSQLSNKVDPQAASDLFREYKSSKGDSFQTWYETESKV